MDAADAREVDGEGFDDVVYKTVAAVGAVYGIVKVDLCPFDDAHIVNTFEDDDGCAIRFVEAVIYVAASG